MPADVRAGLKETMNESIAYGNKVAFIEAANYRDKVLAAKKAEVLPMSKADTAKWRAAMKPVWKRFEDEIGKDLIKAAQGENM